MTFLQLKQRLARRRGANDTTLATPTAARYADAINEAYHEVLRHPWAGTLRDTTTTKASVAGTQSYSVTSCARINRIFETTNDITLRRRSLAWLREQDPDPQQGTPEAWISTDIVKTTQVFYLWPTPSSIITYTLDITSPITEMSADGDIPLLPDDFHDLLIDKAELKELRKADDPARHAILTSAVARAEADLRAWIVAAPDYRPFGPQTVGRSRLGAMFPAGT